jgi:hypothetical protein
VVAIFGGVGGFYAHTRYGGAALGAVAATVSVMVLIEWLLAAAM